MQLVVRTPAAIRAWAVSASLGMASEKRRRISRVSIGRGSAILGARHIQTRPETVETVPCSQPITIPATAKYPQTHR